MNRVGDYIETHSGIMFYPLDPRMVDIILEDIAHGLSQICRFNGQCKFFYSVAQHSINVYKLLKSLGHTNEWLLLDAILHDASEAYLCDLPRPLKGCIPKYKEYEKVVQDMINQKFGLPKGHFDTTKWADEQLLSYEASILMPCKTWNHNPVVLEGITIEEKLPSQVKEEFLSIVKELLEWQKES